MTYASYGQALLEQKCLGCHRPGDENPPLATQAQVQANRARILQEAVYTDAMPQDDDMSLAERERLGEWLACGAL